jgi:CO/xanthine dehydrogenase FAD-binding subunit
MVVGSRLGDGVLREAERLAAADVDPMGDIHASAAYRSRLTGVLVGRALHQVRTRQEVAHV